jgi:DNA polymerase-3 subunit gamma/tau
MSHVALARKWRPQRFDDVIGQRGVVTTLKNAIASGRLAQSFIFAGPRGVGKTTTARILARALNCVTGPTPEPCGECDACVEIAQGRDVDVLEIDGATYTGVDAVREVIVEPLAIAPMRDRFKIFIIDEVHRLSKSAFDALLKSIEEPPPYVKFMMATTDPQAVPATIQSRSQIFELKTLPSSLIRDQLRDVVHREGVAVDDGALALVARAAEGSMRDALSALDQVLAFTTDRITVDDVSTVLGLIGRDLQFEIVEAVAREDAAAAFTLAEKVIEAGFDPRTVCRELARLLRDIMVVNVDSSRLQDPDIASEHERDRLRTLTAAFSREDVMRAFDLLSKAETDIRAASQPRHQFEMALVKWIHLRKLTPLSDLVAAVESGGGKAQGSGLKAQAAPAAGLRSQGAGLKAQDSGLGAHDSGVKAQGSGLKPPGPPAPGPTGRPAVSPPQVATPPSRPTNGHDERAAAPAADVKGALLAAIRQQNKTFASMVIAQAQKIEVQGDAIVFTFVPLHRALRAQLEARRGWIEQLAQSVSGRRMQVRTIEAAPPQAEAASAPAAPGADLKARARAEPAVQEMLDVFGGDIEDVEEIR